MELDLKELEKIEKVKNSYTYPERVYEKIIYKNLNKLPINMKECALANIVKFIKHSHLVATCDVDEALFFNKNGIPFTRKIDEKFINDFKTIYEEVENKYQKIIRKNKLHQSCS